MERRAFLESIGDGAFAVWMGANAVHLRAAVQFATDAPANAPFEVLSERQAALFDAVSAQIVPTDETPGAREAHVVRMIDHSLASFLKDFHKPLTDALAELETFSSAYLPDRTPFVNMSSAYQISVLTDFERARPRFFNTLRSATMLGMFSHPMHGGNTNKIGWKMLGFVDQYSWAPPFGYYDRA